MPPISHERIRGQTQFLVPPMFLGSRAPNALSNRVHVSVVHDRPSIKQKRTNRDPNIVNILWLHLLFLFLSSPDVSNVWHPRPMSCYSAVAFHSHSQQFTTDPQQSFRPCAHVTMVAGSSLSSFQWAGPDWVLYRDNGHVSNRHV